MNTQNRQRSGTVQVESPTFQKLEMTMTNAYQLMVLAAEKSTNLMMEECEALLDEVRTERSEDWRTISHHVMKRSYEIRDWKFRNTKKKPKKESQKESIPS